MQALASLHAHKASLHIGCRYGLQVQALDSLAKALHVEVLELRRERARALSSRGLWGHFKNLLGYLLSIYCLFKYVIPPPRPAPPHPTPNIHQLIPPTPVKLAWSFKCHQRRTAFPV